ncbi:hypothetical protein E1263_18425 [Kribbella antibiotica]|uniref:Uncharacterized protein n=1 Tax=Kribbella antibiotica TaxID=190195 RepID=A0A4R4ZKB2_9ACTN|nr:hypothetical protein [Kribbella antibiotica]TDD58590.1 hypothetical protein E1263_18425 [Kribbella antibiotica]
MNEEDLNEAMRDEMVRSSPPPSMDPAGALDQARRVRKRRRATWAGLAVVPLVAGVVAAPTAIAHFTDSRSVGQVVAGSPSTTPSSAPSSAPKSVAPPAAISTVVPSTRKTNDPWPEGQTDRTAKAGPRAARSVTLMEDLSSSVPAGFTAPNLKYPDGRAMRSPQSQYASNDGEPDYWEYQASIPVQKDNRVGQLFVQSTTPDSKRATAPCKLAQSFWGGTGSCTVLDVDGKKVAVVTTKGRDSFDQWAAYRHDDGTVVFLAQVKKTDLPNRQPLAQPVFTPSQLAELVTSDKFHINS